MKRILIVEDDENERFTLARVLERAGCTVVSLPRADSVLAALAEAPYDALITDMMMPGTDGVSLARAVASRHPEMPIILTSAFHLFRAQVERFDITKLHFVDKPIDLDRLLDLLGVKPVAGANDTPGKSPPPPSPMLR